MGISKDEEVITLTKDKNYDHEFRKENDWNDGSYSQRCIKCGFVEMFCN